MAAPAVLGSRIAGRTCDYMRLQRPSRAPEADGCAPAQLSAAASVLLHEKDVGEYRNSPLQLDERRRQHSDDEPLADSRDLIVRYRRMPLCSLGFVHDGVLRATRREA